MDINIIKMSSQINSIILPQLICIFKESQIKFLVEFITKFMWKIKGPWMAILVFRKERKEELLIWPDIDILWNHSNFLKFKILEGDIGIRTSK